MGKGKNTHKNLEIWQKGIDLVENIYKITKNFPDDEKYGLISQMKRASASFPSNIAEGAARSSRNEYIKFLYIALGSLSELETQVIIAKRLNYIKDNNDIMKHIESLSRKTYSLINYLKSQSK